jgi:putative two-component system protein, hydrogenase maturation factor HypX/HoxX
MRILLLSTAFNSLTQRVLAELADGGHTLAVTLAACGQDEMRAAFERHKPDLVIAPMLTSAIPDDLWTAYPCLIVHPGPVGDRGPSALDWAMSERAGSWGVTVLQAVAEMDAGPVWATARFEIPQHVSKSDLYRNELSDAACAAVLQAVARFASGAGPLLPAVPEETVNTRPYYRQELRRIDWANQDAETVSHILRTADSSPGVLDEIGGAEYFLYGGVVERRLRGEPGSLLAVRGGAVCRATADAGVWLTHAKARRLPGGRAPVKLPAALALADRIGAVPRIPAPRHEPGSTARLADTLTDIAYLEDGGVGWLWFSFPGGAMSTDQCRRLLAEYRYALTRDTRVLILGGARDVFATGIHLGVIDAAPDPAVESWENINAIDDLVEAIVRTEDRLVVAALGGNAAAGGLMLALAADEVWCRDGAVLNPHYRLMGLYGSEYWTYSLPRRVGVEQARRLTDDALPVSARRARALGLVDELLPVSPGAFPGEVAARAAQLAASAGIESRLAAKAAARARDEAVRPLAAYRATELAEMHRIFFDPQQPYHALRAAFVRKTVPPHTPQHLESIPVFPQDVPV